ncbi:hypothetical protein MRX96_054371 [Rhipicephalus microplus]
MSSTSTTTPDPSDLPSRGKRHLHNNGQTRNALLSGRVPYRSSAMFYNEPERRGRSGRHRMSFYDMGLEKRFPEVDQRGFHEDIFEESFGDFSPVK